MTSPDDDDHTALPTYAPFVSGLQPLMSAIDPAPDPYAYPSNLQLLASTVDHVTQVTHPSPFTAIPYANDPPFAPNVFPLQTFPSDATSEGDQSFRNDSFL